MISTSLTTLAIVLLATSIANLSTIVDAYQVPASATSQDAYYAALRDIVQMLLEKQPAIYQEIMNGQLRPGMPGQQGMGFNPYQSYPPVMPGPFNYRQQDANRMGRGGYQLQPSNNMLPPQSANIFGQLAEPNKMSDSVVSPSQFAPTNSIPNIDPRRQVPVKRVASADGRVVLNLGGYIHLLKDNSNLALDFDNISIDAPGNDGERVVVTLSSEDIKFNIVLHIGHKKPQKGFYLFDRANLEMFVKNKEDGSFEKVCYFDEDFAFQLTDNLRLHSDKSLSNECSINGEPSGRLVLDTFEIDLENDPQHSKGR